MWKFGKLSTNTHRLIFILHHNLFWDILCLLQFHTSSIRHVLNRPTSFFLFVSPAAPTLFWVDSLLPQLCQSLGTKDRAFNRRWGAKPEAMGPRQSWKNAQLENRACLVLLGAARRHELDTPKAKSFVTVRTLMVQADLWVPDTLEAETRKWWVQGLLGPQRKSSHRESLDNLPPRPFLKIKSRAINQRVGDIVQQAQSVRFNLQQHNNYISIVKVA